MALTDEQRRVAADANGIGRLRDATGLTLADCREILRCYYEPHPQGVAWTREEAHDMLHNWLLYAIESHR